MHVDDSATHVGHKHHATPPLVPGAEYTCPMHPEVVQDGPGPCPKCGMALEPTLPVARTEYTCPMHPEIVRGRPGSCPICGMALEPRTVTAAEEPNPELIDMTRRFWVATALAVPILALAMVPDLLGVQILQPALRQWVQLALATPVVVWAGWPFLVRGAASIRSGNLNMFTLISLGVGIAYLYSLAATAIARIVSGLDAHAWRGAQLFRGCRDDHRPGPAGPGAGTARTQPDRQRDQGVTGAGAQDRPHHPR